jgi:GWxTD domain-containing protein
LIFLISCSLFEEREKLDPESEKFLSETRYIITPEEKKEFLRLPPEKRKDYIEEFWKRRPAGFKEEYYKRIDEANKLFRGGGRPGWLQDRGMVYIIYGPPTQIERYPMGSISYPYAHEIWHYEYIEIVFYDPYNSGDYRLTPESLFILDTIKRIPTVQVLDAKPIKEKAPPLKFDLESEKIEEGINLKILIPYEKISLKEISGRLETEIEISLIISGAQSIKRSENYKISYSKEEIEKLNERYFRIEIPLKLKKGKYTARITILNKFSKEKGSGKIDFSI